MTRKLKALWAAFMFGYHRKAYEMAMLNRLVPRESRPFWPHHPNQHYWKARQYAQRMINLGEPKTHDMLEFL